MNQLKKDEFVQHIRASITQKTLINLVLLNKRNKTEDLKKLTVRLVELKAGLRLSFVHRFPTNDITKNHSIDKGLEHISDYLETTFAQAELHTTQKEFFFSYPEKGKTKITSRDKQAILSTNHAHDHNKKRPIDQSKIYLNLLGISNEQGKILKDKQAKYKQINKFIEIIDPIIRKSKLKPPYSIADMGSGKGYLTFALYDHIVNNLNQDVQVIGIELRKSLVNHCNEIAKHSGFEKLNFQEGTIETSNIKDINVLIALHACNTATDDAIAQGINSNAEIIICSPCCHKQIRKQIEVNNAMNAITQFGILKERQAEIITDTIRALVLEYYGYKTNVMEFISTEHTPKNLLIVGVKNKIDPDVKKSSIEKIQYLKKSFGIEKHHLEKLMDL